MPARFDWVPFWYEPMEMIQKREVREIFVIKSAQTGGTFSMIIVPLLWQICEHPAPTMLAGPTEQLTDAFVEERVKAAIQWCCKPAAAKYRRARIDHANIRFPEMIFSVSHSGSSAGMKSRPIEFAYITELAEFKPNAIEKLRERVKTYPFSKLIAESTPEHEYDPAYVEWKETDQRYWMMRDPGTGKPFRFQFRKDDKTFYLSWDHAAKKTDNKWDLERVRATAQYITPDGTVITDKDKSTVIKTGTWVATRANAPAWKRGYHINAFLAPWVSFADIAAAFCDADNKRNHRTFITQWLAEPWVEEHVYVQETLVHQRQGDYAKRNCPEPGAVPILTVDVQKMGFWYIIRGWKEGASWLIEWGSTMQLEEIEQIARVFRCAHVFINTYSERKVEVYDACQRYKWNAIRGASKDNMPRSYIISQINPYEGTALQRQGSELKIACCTIDTNEFKHNLLLRVNGNGSPWYTYKGIEPEYVRQMASEEYLNGEWIEKGANHLWDCEVYQVAGATIAGLNRHVTASIAPPSMKILPGLLKL